MLKPIKSQKDHELYLERAYKLMQTDIIPDSIASDELEVISILIEVYENENYSLEAPSPIEAILFRMDQLGMMRSELGKLLGSRSRVSEILQEKRKLSIGMIRKLNEDLGISAQILIKDYELVSEG